MHVCPEVLKWFGLLRCSLASLVKSLNALHPGAPTTAEGLTRWLREITPSLEVTNASAPPSDAPHQLVLGPSLKDWPSEFRLPRRGLHFGLFPSSLVFGGKCPSRFRHILHIPANRAILEPADETDSYVAPLTSPVPLSLIAYGDGTLPSIGEDAVLSLADHLRDSAVWGPLRLTLRWDGQFWPMDSFMEDEQTVLDAAGLLPLDAPRLRRDSPDLSLSEILRGQVAGHDPQNTATLSYACLLPHTLKGKVGSNLSRIGSDLRRQFLNELLLGLSAGQHQLWLATQRALARSLNFLRRCAMAQAYNRPAPSFSPIFVNLSDDKARYPPGLRLQNLAREWLPMGDPDRKIKAFDGFCVHHNVRRADKPTLRLAILEIMLERQTLEPAPWAKGPVQQGTRTDTPVLTGPLPSAATVSAADASGAPAARHTPASSYVMSTGSSIYDVATAPVSTSDDPGSTWGRCQWVATNRAATSRGGVVPADNAPSVDGTRPLPGPSTAVRFNASPGTPGTGDTDPRPGVPGPTGLPDFIGPQPEQLFSRGDRVLQGRLHILVPDPIPQAGDHNFLPDSEVGCLRPGGVLSQAMVRRLSIRIYNDAINSRGISSRDFFLAPPVHLTRDSSSMRLEHIEELYSLTCERSHHPHILIPFLVKRHWLLAVVKPSVPVGELMVLSSRHTSGMRAVRRELHSFFCNKRINHRLAKDLGHPIVSWTMYSNISLREAPGSRDGGVYLLLNLAALLLCSPRGTVRVSPCDTTKVRSLLAGLLAPIGGGLPFNFYESSPLAGVPPPRSPAAPTSTD